MGATRGAPPARGAARLSRLARHDDPDAARAYDAQMVDSAAGVAGAPHSPSGAGSWSWTPGPRASLWLSIAGLVVTVAAGLGYLGLYGASRPPTSATLAGGELALRLLATLVLSGAALVAHEGLHGLAMLPFGARPTFGAGVLGGAMPYLYCTARGHLFTPAQFAWIALAPTVLLGAAFAALSAWAPWGVAFVIAGAVHLGGCVGDWALAAVALRRGRRRLVEDTGAGIRLHRRSGRG